MRYGRLSQKDYRDLGALVTCCAEQAEDGAVWWHERHRAAKAVGDRVLAAYAQTRRERASLSLDQCRRFLTSLDDLRTRSVARDFVMYQEGRAFGAPRPAGRPTEQGTKAA